jgi:hypothetical protein
VSTKDQQWALNQLRHQKNAFLLTLAAMRLFNSGCLSSLIGRSVIVTENGFVFDPEEDDRKGKRFEINFTQIVNTYETDRANFFVDLEESYKYARRALIKESFETAKAYDDDSKPFYRLQSYQWFNFVRVIRNAISHDMHWQFNKADRRLLPIVWDGISITQDMESQDITTGFLNPHLALSIWSEIQYFVQGGVPRTPLDKPLGFPRLTLQFHQEIQRFP